MADDFDKLMQKYGAAPSQLPKQNTSYIPGGYTGGAGNKTSGDDDFDSLMRQYYAEPSPGMRTTLTDEGMQQAAETAKLKHEWNKLQDEWSEYTRGRGNRSYLRQDYGTGSYTEGMQAVQRRRQQQEWQKANADYESALQEYNKAAEATRRVSAVAGPVSPEKQREIDAARSTEQRLKERMDALKASADALQVKDSGFTDWEGRDALVKEYKQLQTRLNSAVGRDDPTKIAQYQQDKARFDEVKRQLQEGDRKAGNGAADYSFEDRVLSTTMGAGKRIAGGLANTALTAVDFTAKYNPYLNIARAVNNRFGNVSENPTTFRTGMDKLYAAADRISESAVQDIERAKNGLNGLGKGIVDIGENVLEMGFDAAVGAATGGGSLVSMFARVFGDSAREARQAGATLEQQVGYGVAGGGIEVLTEKLFDGVAGIYGKGAADNITETVIRRLSSTPTGQTMLRGLIGAINEGNEEVLSDLLNPLAQAIYREDSIGQLYRELDPSEVLYDFLIGAAVGGLGGVTSVATGQSRALNATNNYISAMYEQAGESPSFGREVRDRFILERQMENPDAYNAANLSTKENAQEAMRALRGQQTETARAQELQQTQRIMEEQAQQKQSGRLLTTVFSDAGIDLTEDEHKALTGLVNEGGAGVTERILGMRDAYKAGESGQKLADVMLEMEGRGLTNRQISRAWAAGANVQTDMTGPVDVNTDEGRATLEANLAPLGTHIDAAIDAYDSKQDAARYSAAMQKAAFLYAANGANLAQIVQDARDGKVADIVGYLTDEQVKIAQDIGNEQRTQIREAEQTAAARTQELQEQAAAITKGQTVTAQALAEMDTAIDVANKASQRAVDTINQTVANLEAMAKANPKAAQTEAYKKAYDAAMQQKKKIEGLQKTVTELRRRKAELEGRKTIQRKKGTVSYSGGTVAGVKYDGVDQTKLTRQQQKVVAMVERLADAVNLDYVFISADPGMGGAYVKGGTVYVNINAGIGVGSFSQTMAAASLSHELTHWMQEYAPEQYRELKDFIVSEILKADPQELNRLVQQQQRWEKGRSLSYEQALDEVVANACQTMLLDSKAINKLARQNMNLAERIKDFIEDWSNKIKEAFAEVDTSQGSIYDSLRAVEGSLDQIQELWDKGIEAAAQSYNAEQTVRADVAESATTENAAQNIGDEQFMKIGVRDDGIEVYETSAETKALTWDERIRQYLDLMQNEYRGRTARFVRNGHVYYALFDQSSLRKPIYGDKRSSNSGKKALIRSGADGDIFDLVENSEYDRSSPNKKNHTSADYFDYFVKTVQIDGKVYDLIADVEKDQKVDGGYIYTLALRDNKTIGAAPITQSANKGAGEADQGNSVNQSITDSAPESKAQNQTQFQMISDVEETPRLVAVHNKSVSGLQRMMERGGVPFPSIAIKKAGTSHEGFGDVSIVFPRATIDPAASRWNRLYSNDAWTPTEPRTEYEADELWTLRNDVQNMPAPYFEAKPRRIVYPEEALAYILPDTAPKDLIQKLEGKGYNVMTYKAGDEQDRLQKLNSVEGAQFQRWDNEESAVDRLDREATDRQHNAWAPTFYIKMENTINEWTNGKGQPLGAKMAAGQVVGWLKGKGVKAEEIRWSGIVPWLEGKKTVTKDELLQVMAENQISIETQTLQQGKGERYIGRFDFDDLDLDSREETRMAAEEAARQLGLDPEKLEENENSVYLYYVSPESGEIVAQFKKEQDPGRTRWKEYSFPEGENYREVLFKQPSLGGYTNRAMQVHWGEKDVIAHARVQDLTDFLGRRVLFIEEIQSDLHNEGAKSSFESEDSDAKAERIRKAKAKVDSLESEYTAAMKESSDLAYDLLDAWKETGSKDAYDATRATLRAWINGHGRFPTVPRSEESALKADEMLAAMRAEDRLLGSWFLDPMWDQILSIRNRVQAYDNAVQEYEVSQKRASNVVPDAPFAGTSDTYHEYVMKHLLRMAAEGDYFAIGWTTAQQQSERWSNEFEEGYKIEYDQKLPKFMRKYVKQWGADVTTLQLGKGNPDVWGVRLNDAMKQSVLTEGQPLFQRWDDTDGDNAAERNGREQSYARLQSENKILSNTIKGLNKIISKKDATIGQLQDRLKLNKTPEVREADAKKLARQLLREHNSIADFEGVAADIKALGDYLVQAKEVSEDEVKNRARNIAAEILENATEQYRMEDEQLDTVRGEIKGRKLTISPDFLGELDQAGGYDLFRKQNFGKFTLARADSKNINHDDYMSVSQFYADMQNQYGKTYFPDAANEGEEAIILASVMQAADPIEVNPYRQYMGEATEELANRITQDALNGILRLEPDRYADAEYLKEKSRNEALNARVKQLVEENALSKEEAGKLWQQVHDLNTQLEHADLQYRALMNAAEDRIWQVRAEGIVREVMTKAKERERAAKNIQALKDHYKELQQNAKERRDESAGATKYRKQVFEKAKKLREMLLKNDDKMHVPEVLKAPLAAFLESLDFTSTRALRGGAETNADRAFAANLQKIQQILSNQQDYINGKDMQQDLGGYIDVSPDSMDFLRRVSEMITTALSDNREYTINQMSAAELKDLSNFLSNLRTAIKGMNYFMANARFESVREAASKDIQTIQELGRVGTTENGKLFHAAAWENGTPYYIFRRFGEGGKAIFDSLTRGWEKMAFNVKKIMDFTEKTYSDKEVREWQQERHEIELEDGRKVTMTTGQIMSLSMLLNREQARKHMDKGGVRIGDIKGKKGTIADITHYHLTGTDISNIIGKLTDRQADVARKLQHFMAEQGSEWGNEISMRRFGYRFYTEGDAYFPIKTDSTDRPMSDTDAQQNSMFRLLNLSASKSLNPKATNALVVEDIFDVFADHMSDMAKLNGMGLPILDAIKWFNFKERIDLGDGQYDTRTMQATMEEAFGKQALSYFRTLMKDINGVTESGDRGADPFSKLVSNYKAAAVAANLRVAFLQPTSYVRASYLIKPKYLLQAFTNKNAYKEAMENSGTAVWKSLGYYDTNIARGMRDQIKHNESWKDKVIEKSMGLAEFGDRLTWGRLWVACKMQTAAETGLQGEELKQKTADLFREVIYSSQVMDSTLTRSELMRGKSMHTKALTAFMAEPTLSYNMVMDAGMEYRMNARRYGKGEAWQRSKGYIAKAFTVYACSAAFSAVVESIADAFRDDDDEESFLLKWSQAMFGEGNLLKGNLAQDLDLFGKQPYLRNVMSLLQGYKNRDMSVAALEVFIDTYKIWKETIDLATGTLEKPTKTTYYGNMTTWGKIYKTMQAVSQMTGLAAANLSRDVLAVWNTTVGAMYPEYKVKTYDPGPKKAIQDAYTAGRMSEEEAIQKLLESGTVEDEDKAYWTVRDWEGEDKYSQLKEAALNGDADTVKQELEQLTAHGVKEKTAISNLKSFLKKAYTGEELDKAESKILGDRQLTDSDVQKILTQFGGMDDNEAYLTVKGWETGDSGKYIAAQRAAFTGDQAAFKAEMQDLASHGVKEKDVRSAVKGFVRDAFMGKELSEEQSEIVGDHQLTEAEARKMLHYYAGLSVDDANKAVAEWKEDMRIAEKYGAEYEKYDLTTAQAKYFYEGDAHGKVTLGEYAKQLESYGMDRVKAYYGTDGWRQTGLTMDQYDKYATEAAKCKGVDNDGDGKADANSVKSQKLVIINSLPVSTAVKDAIYRKNNWAESGLKNTPWH